MDDTDWDRGGELLGAPFEAKDGHPDDRLRRHEDRQRTRLAMRAISGKGRQVLGLVVYRGLEDREAARVLGIPLGTVKSRMHKAPLNLRDALLVARHGKV